ISVPTGLAREYAKCKNRQSDFAIVMRASCGRVDRACGAKETAEMTDDPASPAPGRKPLTPAAQRALAEAEERRRQAAATTKPMERELHGPSGPEPSCYGYWEYMGIASVL